MKRVTLTDFSGGMNEAANPQLLPDNVFADILNYEYRGIEGLTKRYVREIEADLDALTDDEDNTIHPIQSMAIWYPSRMPAGAMAGADKIYIIQANDRIVAYYRTSAVAWSKTLLLDRSPERAKYHSSPDRLLIADGTHPLLQCYVTIRNELVYFTLGLRAPRYAPEVSLAGDDQFYVEPAAVDRGMGIEKGNILQYCYTVEDIYGAESNPSPICTEHGLMWKYPDADAPDGYAYYWYRTKISGLLDSQYTETERSRLKYFNIYRRDIEFIEGNIATSFVLVKRLSITSTGVYVDDSGENLADISYENDVSPITNNVVGTGSAIFLSADKNAHHMFPFDFDEYLTLSVDNNNNIDYALAVIGIKVPWIAAGKYDVSSVFRDIPANIDKIRLYFEDMITPLPVIYAKYEANLLLITKLPHLDRNRKTQLYLALASASAGVDDALLQTYATGRFQSVADLTDQNVFYKPGVQSNSQILLSYYVGAWYNAENLKVMPNKANETNNGESAHYDLGWYDSAFDNVRIFAGNNTHQTLTKTVKPANVSYLSEEKNDINWETLLCENDLAVLAMIRYVCRGAGDGSSNTLEIRIPDSATKQGVYILDASTYLEFRMTFGANTPVGYVFPGTRAKAEERINPDELGLESFEAGQELYISLLWQRNSCYAIVRNGSYEVFRKVNSFFVPDAYSPWPTADAAERDFAYRFQYRAGGGGAPFAYTEEELILLDVRTNFGGYAESEAEDVIRSFECGIPYYRSPVGARIWDAKADWDNNGTVEIKWSPVLTTAGTPTDLRWSDISGGAFPSLNSHNVKEPILAIVDVPSFLQQEYQNTIVVFTRNTVSRLVLSDDLTQMASREDNLIKEFSYGGLYAPNSLVNTPFGLVWLSEAGLLLWSPEGVQPLTSGVLDLQHKGRPNDFYGAFYGMNNQYLLHDSGRDRTYAYHFEQKAWTRFDDMGFDNAVCLNLGSDYHNDLLLSDGEHVYRYPSLTAKASNTQLVTKKYTMDNVKPVRMRLMWDGTPPDSITATTANAFFAAGIIQTWEDADWQENEIPRFKWIFFPLGFWGEYVQFTLNNIEALTRLELDLKEGV